MNYAHDCSACRSLGTFTYENVNYDLYICLNKRENLHSILARYGNGGSEYISWHPPEAFAYPEDFIERHTCGPYFECMRRASDKKYYTGKFAERFKTL